MTAFPTGFWRLTLVAVLLAGCSPKAEDERTKTEPAEARREIAALHSEANQASKRAEELATQLSAARKEIELARAEAMASREELSRREEDRRQAEERVRAQEEAKRQDEQRRTQAKQQQRTQLASRGGQLTTPEWTEILVGMDESEVLSLIGRPDRVNEGAGPLWEYKGRTIDRITGESKSLTINYRNGRVGRVSSY